MSEIIQKQFEKFHEKIKLKRFDENKILKDKRDIITNKLRDGLKKKFKEMGESAPRWEFFNQGSYDIGTGIKPLNSDYDIDIGLRFFIDKDDYKPLEVKKWVYDILNGHTKEVRIKEPCVTVQYQSNDEPAYHVDLAVYAVIENMFLSNSYYLARGKEHASEENKFWEEADPIRLSDELKSIFSDEEDKQYRRVIRYLKRWKDLKFSKDGNATPAGIGITVAAYNWFSPEISFFHGKPDDLAALKNFVGSIINKFTPRYNSEEDEYYYRLNVEVPVKPKKDIFYKMSDKQMLEFKTKLETLKEVLTQASNETDPHEAAKILAKQFGDDFPIPEKEDTA
ncbi:MAG: nucleotidyltransferase, partial [Balneola sp.]|nr:nucleotidyltransferase [Balneola sp.]